MTELKTQYDQSIRQLVPINGLTAHYQDQLIQRSRILELRKGKHLFKQGETDNYAFYLLQGEIEMLTDGQHQGRVKGDSESSRYALAQLQPRQFTAVARTPAIVLQVDRGALDKLLVFEQKQQPAADADEGIVEVSGIDEQEAGDWMTCMLQSELFAHMPTANIHQLFAALEPVELEAGEVVVQQGGPGDYYYIIQEGRCEVLRRAGDGNEEVRLAELKPGDGFGEEALLSGATRNATVRMLTPGVAMRLTKEQFIELIKKPSLSAVNYDQAEQLVAQGAEWIDVRLPEEYEQSHIRNSRNLPLSELRARPDALAPDHPYVIYCDSGGRSSVAAFLLTDRGFTASYLEGGLMHCPDAVLTGGAAGAASPQPVASESKTEPPTEPPERVLDPDILASAYRAELAVADIEMQSRQENTPAADADQAEREQQWRTDRAQLEAAKQRAEAEAARQRKAETEREQKLKQAAERQLRAQKKKLEAVYARNAEEMSKLQQLKQQVQAEMQAARDKAETESAEARRRKEEVDRIKQQLEEARAALNQSADQQRRQQAELEQKVQAKAKQKLEAERRRLAEQFQRSNSALEQAQRERAEAEAARKAAAEEAERIIAEFKAEHARTRAEEEARLQAEREKLERESRQIHESLAAIRNAKEEAESARRAAEAQVAKLKSRLEQAESSQDQALQAKLKDAEVEMQQARRDLEQADHAHKMAEAAQQDNIQDLARQSEEEKQLRAQIEQEVSAWLEENQLEAPSKEALEKQAEHMRRIKQRADEAKQQAQSAAQNLLDEVSSQLGGD